MSESQFVHTFEYGTDRIGLGTDGNFYPLLANSDPDDKATHSCETLAKAQDYLDRKAREREKSAKAKLEIPVIGTRRANWSSKTQRTGATIITGIHAGHGKLIFKDKSADPSRVFYNHPVVASLLDQIATTESALSALNEQLAQYEIKLSHHYGAIREGQYELLVKELTYRVAKIKTLLDGAEVVAQ